MLGNVITGLTKAMEEQMVAFIQTYGILIILGAILLFLFVWISRARSQPGNTHQTEAKQNDGNHRHGCC